MKKDFRKNLENMLRAGFACIWVQTFEEERALKVIHEVCKKLQGKLHVWDCLGQVSIYDDVQNSADKKIEDPVLLFPQFVSDFGDKAVLAILDFWTFIEQPSVIRSIKNNLNLLRKDGKVAIFVGPRLTLPAELDKDITVLDFPLPQREELKGYLDFVVESAVEGSGVEIKVGDETKDKLVDGALGLTSQESEDAFSFAIAKNSKLNGDSVQSVLDMKSQTLRKDGMLEYLQVEENMESIGGLDNLKHWLVRRKRAFGQAARAFGLPNPKGILLVGISGCGKSLTAKACASNWEIPLVRFDVGRVFNKLMGESEGNIRKVIQIAETMAPCVLWIDEAEKGLSGTKASGELDSGVTARVVGTILTWMQEKTAPVFVIATANDVSKLPPELLRKGRFDEIFFVDLPNEEERSEIVKIQLKKRNRELGEMEMKKIVEASKDYTGAEIEQAVIAGLYECFEEKERKLTANDVVNAIKSFIPLSTTMQREIDELRDWGIVQGRARNASLKVRQIPSFLGSGAPKARTFTFKKQEEKIEEKVEDGKETE